MSRHLKKINYLTNVSKIIIICTLLKIILNYFSYKYVLNLKKLFLTDSLSILYIFSSTVYTIWILYILLVMLVFIQRNVRTNILIIFFLINSYYIYRNNTLLYVIIPLKTNNVNLTLQNGLLNVHPQLMYYMYVILMIYMVFTYSNSSVHAINKQTTNYQYRFVLLGWLGMYLGALWASQELNWGGFWSWDPVELISLLISIYSINQLHNKNLWFFNKSIIWFFLFILLIYVVIRLGIINTIHSFIKTTNTPYYISIVVILTSIYTIYYSYLNMHRILINNINTYASNIRLFNLYVLLYICSLIVNAIFHTPIFVINHVWFIIFFLVSIAYLITTNTRLTLQLCGIYITLYTWFFLGLFYKIHGYIYTIAFVFMGFFVLKYCFVHHVILIIYLWYVLFFINNAQYVNTDVFSYLTQNLSCLSINSGFQNMYETTFFLFKNNFYLKIKNIYYHVTGFSILSNSFSSKYVFLKNFSLKCLFSIETITTTVCMIIFVIVLYYNITYYVNTRTTLKTHQY